MYVFRVLLSLAIGLAGSPLLVWSQASDHAPAPHHAPAAGHAHEAPSYHHDAVEVFVGESMRLDGHHGPSLTLGLDYEHRFDFWDHHLGLGMMVDCECWREGFRPDWLVSPTLELYPFGHLKLFAGGGICLNQRQMLPLLRLGGAYEIDLGHHLLLMPLIEMDRTPAFTAITSGLCLGFGR